MAHGLGHASLYLGNLDAEFGGDHFIGLCLEPVPVEHRSCLGRHAGMRAPQAAQYPSIMAGVI